jgi:aminotransferase
MISVFGSFVGKEELQEISECIDSQWLGLGAKVGKFENQFKARLGLDNFLFVDSGSNALYMAVELLDLPKNSEIILPTFTWVACAQAILLAGHKPVFCDVDLDSQNVGVENIRPHITSRTGAVMVVHYAGKPVDLSPIVDLGYPVIEDAAHAVDSKYKGKACGSIGDVGIYSFDAVKNLTTGGGGGITVRNPGRFERARKLRYCGIGQSSFEALKSRRKHQRWWEYEISNIFIHMSPSDVSAGIGLAQLRRLDALQESRRSIWNRYQEAFRPIEWIDTPVDPGVDEQHSYFTYLMRVPHRDQLARRLLEKEIYTTLRFHPLHLNAIYKSGKALPNAEALNDTGLNIPLHPRLSQDDVEYVIDTILNATS